MAIYNITGAMRYSMASGSHYPSVGTGDTVQVTPVSVLHAQASFFNSNAWLTGSTTTITQSLTVKYFQRVFDSGTSGYCYYTATSIDPTPASSSTTPNITGVISDHSIVKILEIY